MSSFESELETGKVTKRKRKVDSITVASEPVAAAATAPVVEQRTVTTATSLSSSGNHAPASNGNQANGSLSDSMLWDALDQVEQKVTQKVKKIH